jgi:hypothetical protein
VLFSDTRPGAVTEEAAQDAQDAEDAARDAEEPTSGDADDFRSGALAPGVAAVRAYGVRHRLVLEALLAWTLTRLAAAWVVAQCVWLLDDKVPVPGFLDRWDKWDVRVFRFIAEYGYSGPPNEPGRYEAFFPGLPLMLRVVHLVVSDWVVAGLLISFVAGGVAVVSLALLVADGWGPVAGRRAVWAMCLSPLALFLSVGYSESLFLAFAFTAVLLARRGQWGFACVAAAGASSVRVTGFFLAAALAVEFVMQYAGRGRRLAPRLRSRPHALKVLWLALPPLPGLVFFWFLQRRSGTWFRYFEVQSDGWGRRDIGVPETFRVMWNAAFTPQPGHPDYAFGYRVEITAVAVGLVLAVVLLLRRRWSEALFVSGPLLLLLPMATYSSAARTSLTWWPLWAGLGVLSCHPRWGTLLTRAYLAVSIPSALLLLAAFSTWRWAG